MEVEFTKVEGTGNDFIVINEMDGEVVPELDKPTFASRVCARKFSVGADGVIFISPSGICDIQMRIFNPDGSEAEMCGNGMRCFAKYVYERGIVKDTKMTVETLGGVITPEVILNDGVVKEVRVFMGRAEFRRDLIPMEGEGEFAINTDLFINDEVGTIKITALNVGNPHAVVVVDNLYRTDVDHLGSLIENHEAFPKRTNVQFVEVNEEDDIDIRTYERGVGETLSCGTGAIAAVYALDKLGLIDPSKEITVHALGGVLKVSLDEEGAYLTGSANIIYDGRIEYEKVIRGT
ncbi:MAG TPA: diaminopimelate epimerase [Candidatus Syntrophoarchaeum butanivorans]|uniref:Diaminopimelate epimerase n=1 Tax=Candidatus Syntropharchaeum butanivorans TaxID=1839936 RepID=A0A1F2P7V7_9EURY|nr:MAG: diaminopimelate epimerase [Candidatus Syntrophoarchaeum butanivorans]RJS70914.1 MAG: diaminopimelate epimerase [Candidatus Syntrophoarchaeum sp. WYZ-LMO15]HDM36297.1 diaminopimelate epimerase [Candidatus Syntrophoarchaeum butanivorans]HEC57444.1 diaminopimelate epimerase [Candidatus Syntrophoarchaeum butanivorans]